MKTGTYYRVQSRKYDVGSESISWHMTCSTVEEAMRRDIFGKWKDDNEFYAQQIRKLEHGAPLQEVWQEFIGAGYKYGWVQPGLSCYEDFGLLLDYWDAFMTEGLEALMEEGEDNYILVFEGEYVGEGSSGEDCVKFIREIRRIEMMDISTIIEFRQRFGEPAREFIMYGGHESIDELIRDINDVWFQMEMEME